MRPARIAVPNDRLPPEAEADLRNRVAALSRYAQRREGAAKKPTAPQAGEELGS